MNLRQEIEVNQFGQGLIGHDFLLLKFTPLDVKRKRELLVDMEWLILQSKVQESDIEPSIKLSDLKPTYTPCVMIRKGLDSGNLRKIIGLPEDELWKVYQLFLYLFKAGYERRFNAEKGDPNKWWYWDLGSRENIDLIYSKHSAT